ncbi:hypothetical protein [Gandjariella thermophila]|uniref:Uncharacterized protein n=1 Tax=Gandjariella thermophila TaxID=1931992 RepID=A0A4D4JI28_9PSEU|nr:hypothetical protein [Gandjariella thermophila]GDY33929.1 hypothetical protein GTS_55620 [Gandjariella thermophila]
MVQLGALAVSSLPGGVLIETLDDLGPPGTPPLCRAVLGRFLQKDDSGQDPPWWYGRKWTTANRPQARRVTAKNVDSWVKQAEESIIQDELDAFRKALQDYLIARYSGNASALFSFITELGSGPVRDVILAKDQHRRLTAHNSDAEISRYLETYGYINPAGTVGRWHHEHMKSLRDNG